MSTRFQSNREQLGSGGTGDSKHENWVMPSCHRGPEEYFQNIVEFTPQRVKVALNANMGPTRYHQGVPNKVTGE